MSKPIEFSYVVQTEVFVTTDPETNDTSVLSTEIAFDCGLGNAQWIDNGQVNRRGINAILLAMAHGINSALRMAADSGMNEATLLRQVIGQIEDAFVLQVDLENLIDQQSPEANDRRT